MKTIQQEIMEGERALFQEQNLYIKDTVFQNGESPLKESRRIDIEGSSFKWKYPVWYGKDITIRNSTWFEMGRAGVWYTDNITVEDSIIEAPKNFRRCDGVTLKNVSLTNAGETLWNCRNVTLEQVHAKGDYFAMNCEHVTVDGLTLVGGYSFDGVKNVEIRNSRLLTKDAFWNSENVTVYDSYISSEYLGWNAKNLTLINCTVESLQGFCYIDNLVLKGCTLVNTDLAFEYSTVAVEVKGHIKSIKNPAGGTIRAGSIGEIIMDDEKIDPSLTTIITDDPDETMKEAI